MKQFGLNLLFLLFYLKMFPQCGGYFDNKYIADSCFKEKKYATASIHYINCLNFCEKKRIDYYYASYSLIKIGKIDSALFYFKIAGQKGLHYATLGSFYADTTIQNLYHYEKWKHAINRVYKNTNKYFHRSDIDSTLLKKLIKIKIEDQKYRGAIRDSATSQEIDSLSKIQKEIDFKNQKWLKKELSQSGWPIISKVGIEGDRIAWLIVQHADNDTVLQRKCLNILKKLLQNEETNLNNVAYLEDRLLINNNKEQIYGTQFETIIINDKIVDLKLKPTSNIECLDKRRAYMNLQPVADYLEFAKKRYIHN